jgi:putative intracellular protease/amidase
MPKMNKILVIVTNADEFEKVGFRTGLWLGELTHFCDVAQESGYQIDIASPSGGKIPIDPESLIISEIGQAVGMEGDVSKRYKDKTFMNLLDNTLKVSDVDPATYDAIYMTGGHGVMFDFPKSAALSDLIARFYEPTKLFQPYATGPLVCWKRS